MNDVITPQPNYVILQKIQEALIGTLLVDGCLGTTTKEGRTWHDRCIQSKKQTRYMFHKYALFR